MAGYALDEMLLYEYARQIKYILDKESRSRFRRRDINNFGSCACPKYVSYTKSIPNTHKSFLALDPQH
jgi:hypothetical protein